MPKINPKERHGRLLLLPNAAHKPTREVLSQCSVPEDFEVQEPTRPKQERGVYRDPFPPPGSIAIVVVDSKGVRRRRIEMPAEDEAADDTVSTMLTWLDEHDPIPVLELHGASD